MKPRYKHFSMWEVGERQRLIFTEDLLCAKHNLSPYLLLAGRHYDPYLPVRKINPKELLIH